MKAKNSLVAMLWPLISALFRMKNRFFDTDKTGKFKIAPLSLELQKVSAESKRIAEKLQETQLLKDAGTSNTQYPGVLPLPENKPLEPEEEDEELVLSGWREDEDDRTRSNDYEFWNYRQNLLRADHPDIMEGNLLALFKADHDAAQFEQYQLENERIPPESETLAVSQLRRFLSGGLNFLFVLIFIMSSGMGKLKGQELTTSQALKIGEQVPDITISNMLHYQASAAKISDFKGKLLILDFWSTTCHASEALLPDLLKLQKAFPGKLQIIAVGKEDLATVKRVASDKGLAGLAFTPKNSQLAALFPHELVPQLVWISAESKVLGITTDYDATEATIQKIINRESVVFKDPKADQIGFDSGKPLFLNGNGITPGYLHRSILTPYCAGLPEGAGILTDSNQVRIHAINKGRLQLYFLALRLPQYFWPASRVVYEPGVDVSKFTSINWVEEKYKKAYCYELTLPSFFKEQANAIMLHDLQKLFGTTAGLEKRMVPCYVLKVTDPKLIPQSKETKRGNNFYNRGTEEKWMTHTGLVELIAYLEEIPGNPPIIDETGYEKPLDLNLSSNLGDIPALNKSLAKYGLQLQPDKRTLDMLIVSPIDVPAPITRKN